VLQLWGSAVDSTEY